MTTPAIASRLPSIVSCLIGLLLATGFGYGAWMWTADHRHMQAVGRATEGTIVGRREDRGRGRGVSGGEQYVSWRPVFRFPAAEGTSVEAVAQQRMEPDDIRVGRTMPIVYDPADPTQVYLATALAKGPGFTPWLLGGVALSIGAASLFFLRRSRR